MMIKPLKYNFLITDAIPFSEQVVAEIESINKKADEFMMYSKIWYVFSGLLLIIQILQ